MVQYRINRLRERERERERGNGGWWIWWILAGILYKEMRDDVLCLFLWPLLRGVVNVQEYEYSTNGTVL